LSTWFPLYDNNPKKFVANIFLPQQGISNYIATHITFVTLPLVRERFCRVEDRVEAIAPGE
jgi:hypothetical protein